MAISRNQRKVERKMTLTQAIDKLFFVESVDYLYYLDCLWGREVHEEQEELDEAKRIFSESGLDLDEVLAKKKVRYANRIPEPIRFIDRPHFIAIETDDLPF
jgi:hypothetical protein